MKRILSRKLLACKAEVLLAPNIERLERAVCKLNRRIRDFNFPSELIKENKDVLHAIVTALVRFDIPDDSVTRIAICRLFDSISPVRDWPSFDSFTAERLDLFILQSLKSPSILIRENTVNFILSWHYRPTYYVKEIRLYTFLIVEAMINHPELRESYLPALERLLGDA